MARKEPKLRPSLSWDEITTALAALDFTIQSHIRANQVTVNTVKMVELQGYLKTFEPESAPAVDKLQAMIAQLQRQQAVHTGEIVDAPEVTTPVEPEVWTDAQRYAGLKLRDSKGYTAEETKFVLDYGMKVMMAEMKAGKNFPLNEDDL